MRDISACDFIRATQQVSPSGFEPCDGAPTLDHACPAMDHRWHPCLGLFCIVSKSYTCLVCQTMSRERFTPAVHGHPCPNGIPFVFLCIFAHVRDHTLSFSKFVLLFLYIFLDTGFDWFQTSQTQLQSRCLQRVTE